MQTHIEGTQDDYKMITTITGYYGVLIETHNKKDNEVMYLKDTEHYLIAFASIKRIYKLNNHNSADLLVSA